MIVIAAALVFSIFVALALFFAFHPLGRKEYAGKIYVSTNEEGKRIFQLEISDGDFADIEIPSVVVFELLEAPTE